MFHVNHIHGTNAFWKIEGFMFRKRFRCEPAFILFPNNGWVQTLFNGSPDREAGSKVVPIDGDIGTITDADLVDLIKELILCITREHVCHAWFHAEANKREQTFLFPLFRFVELIIALFYTSQVK